VAEEGWDEDGWEAAGDWEDDEGWVDDEAWVDDEGWVDDDVVYVPDEPGLLRRGAAIGAVFVLVVVVVLGAGALWVRGKLEPSGPKEPVAFVIPEEASTGQIANLLEEQGVISDATVFRYYVRWQDVGTFQAGTYDGLTTNQAMGDVVARLTAGPLPPQTTRLIIPEGLWVSDTRQMVLDAFPEMDEGELDDALATVRSRYQPDPPPEGAIQPLEGLLFPAGYDVLDTQRGDELALLQQMVDAFDRNADEVGIGDATARLEGEAGRPVTPYEAIIVASLIEEEAGNSQDKPRIARVIYNRLLRGMRLDIDATVNYALQDHKETLTQSDLAVDSPFNTRRFDGMPPTPIAAPGRESLEAALAPSEEEGASQWLYYVLADADGSHFFTGDYDEFLRVADESRAAGLFE
jgi:UPF0755 protein